MTYENTFFYIEKKRKKIRTYFFPPIRMHFPLV